MAITQFPSDLIQKATLACAICSSAIPHDKATAGFMDADRQQAFACNAHFWEGNRFILGWVDFAATERLKLLSRGIDPDSFTKGGCDAWAVS